MTEESPTSRSIFPTLHEYVKWRCPETDIEQWLAFGPRGRSFNLSQTRCDPYSDYYLFYLVSGGLLVQQLIWRHDLQWHAARTFAIRDSLPLDEQLQSLPSQLPKPIIKVIRRTLCAP